MTRPAATAPARLSAFTIIATVAVLIGVLFWWTLWGVPGAFLAVPMIAATKILGD